MKGMSVINSKTFFRFKKICINKPLSNRPVSWFNCDFSIKRQGSWDHSVSGSDPTGRLMNFAGLGSKFLTEIHFSKPVENFRKGLDFLIFKSGPRTPGTTRCSLWIPV